MKLTRLLLVLALLAPLARGEGETIESPSGLKVEILSPGREGTKPSPGDRVKVHYTGRLTNGTKFDSSHDRGEPFGFLLGKGLVIRGWDEGVALLNVGAKAKLTIPPALGYGSRGSPPVIPPNATLVFDVELVEVIPEIPFVEPQPDKLVALESGLKYQVLAEGAGEPATADQGVSFKFAVFSRAGAPVVSSVSAGINIGGAVSALRLGQFDIPFLKEAATIMKPGQACLFEVPAALGFGSTRVSPAIQPGDVTIWYLEVLSVNDVPEFRLPAEDKKQTTESGLAYEVIREGEGESPKRTDTVKVHYTGWLTDGTIFDSSHARGEPISFALNRVIPGWTEGVALMKPGAIYLFEIPGKLAYGPRPPPGSGIPADATLVFLVELISVK